MVSRSWRTSHKPLRHNSPYGEKKSLRHSRRLFFYAISRLTAEIVPRLRNVVLDLLPQDLQRVEFPLAPQAAAELQADGLAVQVAVEVQQEGLHRYRAAVVGRVPTLVTPAKLRPSGRYTRVIYTP